METLPDNPYLLLTPGPLSTTKSVKQVMLRDWCTWDDDYKQIVETIRATLVQLATPAPGYTAVLMQGSGTFCVEACLTTAIPDKGRLLVLANGAYGRRIARIAACQRIDHLVLDSGDTEWPDTEVLSKALAQDPGITHVAVVHCETTTGMLNPVADIGDIVRRFHRTFIVDAMSSFGGIPMDMAHIKADYLISSANKCIQGVPGFGFVIAEKRKLAGTRGNARSLSLDLFDQWETMETGHGKWRFTSPTHVVRAFAKALEELAGEGGVAQRWKRYRENRDLLIAGMIRLGFVPLLDEPYRSPIITAFLGPDHPDYRFNQFYDRLKQKGFVIYPGKVTQQDTFRIGHIGDIHPADIPQLLAAVQDAMYWV
ncbi:MAG: 2-aminoethylphosphonate--pyruvate transaminase [Desulfotignum sp.]|jgi:2-aminoethylphosphonate-pyruvate transaminase|nr:2-aminoethylphosphonate--pyruvate transaminase [Desulfotignum sp.]